MLLRFHLSTLRHPWFCWCLGAGQATGHYPNEWWPGSLTYVYVYRPQRVNSNWTWNTTRRLFHWKSLRIFVLIAFTLFNAYFCSNISQNIWGHYLTWWRHQMRAYSALLALYAGNSPFTGEFPSQGPVTRSFDVFFDLHQSINGWVNNREAGDFRRHYAHYDVIVMDSQEVLVDLAMVKNGWLLQMTFSKVYYYENYFWLTILTYVVAVWVRIIICHPCFG